jgi:rhodanese-related sulfurtransferase
MDIAENKMKKILGIIIMILITTTLSSCGGGTNPTYTSISAAEAKAIMDNEKGYVILDVRTEEEYAAGHIEGAILIPDYEITKKADSALNNKDQLILVYCRSGRRSKNAAATLANLGYTNVKEFGGIIDWPYGIVTE